MGRVSISRERVSRDLSSRANSQPAVGSTGGLCVTWRNGSLAFELRGPRASAGVREADQSYRQRRKLSRENSNPDWGSMSKENLRGVSYGRQGTTVTWILPALSLLPLHRREERAASLHATAAAIVRRGVMCRSRWLRRDWVEAASPCRSVSWSRYPPAGWPRIDPRKRRRAGR